MITNKEDFHIDYQQMNWKKIEEFLRKTITNLPNEAMEVKQFSEGYSNLTYLIKFGDWQGVLRRPPFGKVPPKAHDMKREFEILEKIHPVFPLAPQAYVFCDDLNVIDKNFYVMEKKEGIVIDGELPTGYDSRTVGPLISQSIVENLNLLHSVDYQKSGLSNFGKPEGFVERQVHGWIKRYENSKTDHIQHQMELEEWFKTNIPVTTGNTIVHNDFKMNNLVFDEQTIGQINGVLDWELSTIGDPLTDVGSAVAYWGESGDPNMGISIVTNQPGFFSRREFIEEYSKLSGRDMSDISFYVAFGFYKLAVILQQIYYRWKIGELKDERFHDLNQAVANLFELAQLTRLNRFL